MAHPAVPAVRTRSRRRVDMALLILGAVVTVAALADLIGVFNMTTGLFIINALTGDRAHHQPLTTLPQFLQAELTPGTTGDLTDLGLGTRLLCATPTAINLVTIVLAGLLVAGIISRIQKGQPFSAAVLRGWRRLGGVLVVGGGLQTVMAMVAVGVLASMVAHEDVHPSLVFGASYSGISINGPDVPWMLLLLGIIAGAIALAFREGARLEEEVVGVV